MAKPTRARWLGMASLEERSRRGDLAQMFKTVTGKDKVNSAWWFQPASVREGTAATRQNSGAFNVQEWRED